jgi:transposase
LDQGALPQAYQIERFFNKLKQFRRIATRYDKLGANFLAFLQLVAVRISLRQIASTPRLMRTPRLQIKRRH